MLLLDHMRGKNELVLVHKCFPRHEPVTLLLLSANPRTHQLLHLGWFSVVLIVPASHAAHSRLFVDEAATVTYVPAAHVLCAVQEPLFMDTENVLGGQSTQVLLSTYVPAGHSRPSSSTWHEVWPFSGWVSPSGQSLHIARFSSSLYVFTPQSAHSRSDVTVNSAEMYFPVLQVVADLHAL